MLTVRLRSMLLAASLVFAPSLARAEATCNSCDDCTRLLSTPNAQVQLTADLSTRGEGPCISVRGAGARLNGMNHVILAQPSGTYGLRVEAADVVVRSLRITGVDVAVHLIGARATTLYAVTTEARRVGVRVERSPEVRLEGLRIEGGRVGISLGASDTGTCATGLSVQSPGVVIVRTQVARATTGIAACDARPVITGTTVSGGDVGVVLGDPANGAGRGGDSPWDPCVCSPSLTGIRPGTVALYSSGCSGCQVHEGWLPSVRRRGADVRLRESGTTTAEAQARFDHYAWRCMPGVMDALGIPGCVPNYACVNSGVFAKRRTGESLAVDVSINNEDDVLQFARQCEGSARGRFAAGARCVRQALVDNSFCGNRTIDLRVAGSSARWGGARNRCTRVEGWTEDNHPGCGLTCDAAPTAPPLAELIPPTAGDPANPLNAAPHMAPGTPPPAVPAAVPPTPSPTATPSPAPTPAAAPAPTSDDNGPLWIVAVLVAFVGFGALVSRKR